MAQKAQVYQCSECGHAFAPGTLPDPLRVLAEVGHPCPECEGDAPKIDVKRFLLHALDKAQEEAQVKLSGGQRSAVVKLLAEMWLHTSKRKELAEPRLVLTGYAGTGKTTVMRVLVRAARILGFSVWLAAPTGKASSRLRDATGNATSTVHSLIYGRPEEIGICPHCEKPTITEDYRRKNLKAKHWVCPGCNEEIDTSLGIEVELIFDKKDMPDSSSRPVVLILDEASMLDERLLADVMSFIAQMENAFVSGHLAVCVGDPGQLLSVRGNSSPALEPVTAHLNEIHRQADGSAIIYAAERARLGYGRDLLNIHRNADDEFEVNNHVSLDFVASWTAGNMKQGLDTCVVCYTKTVRSRLNRMIRAKYMGKVTAKIMAGDRLICLSNKKRAGLMNGEILEVLTARQLALPMGAVELTFAGQKGKFYAFEHMLDGEFRDFKDCVEEFRSDELAAKNEWRWSEELRKAFPDANDFLLSRGIVPPDRLLHMGYGYALTVHKAQGSQWDHVGYVWERATWGMLYREPSAFNRHLYTGITRGAKSVSLMILKKGET